eukprot:SAG31_NODE_10914_length_1084_cov_1.793909_2_plen_103_part_00
MARGADQVLHDLASFPLHSTFGILTSLASSVEKSMGGTSGVLYLIGLKAAAGAVRPSTSGDKPLSTNAEWVKAFIHFVQAVVKYGGGELFSCRLNFVEFISI